MPKESRLTFVSENFNCKLKCQRCNVIKDNGERCKNTVCIGAPTCWIHAVQKYGVQVRDTDNDKKGLFATRHIEANQWICPMGGEQITQYCLDNRYPGDITAPYGNSYQTNGGEQRVRDSACKRGIGSMAQAKFKQNGYSETRNNHNAEIAYRPTHRAPWVVALRDIDEDEEIFVYSGDEFKDGDYEHSTYRTTRDDTRPC